MGEVHAAYDQALGRQVAIKLARPDQAAREQAQARLVREAQHLAQLSHPNIVQIYELGTCADGFFIAMEHLPGEHLGAWLENAQTLPARERVAAIVRHFVAAGRALVATHAAGLVHRDFKPDNVVVGPDGRVRVVDFGLARPAAQVTAIGSNARVAAAPSAAVSTTESATVSATASATVSATASTTASTTIDAANLDALLQDTLDPATVEARPPLPTAASEPPEDAPTPGPAALDRTAAGAIVGTPRYMSPEQILGQSTDHRSDQFSFCVSLYRALYGHWPYHGRTWAELTTALTTTDCRCPRARHVARSLRRALQRGLALAPGRRFPSMEALLAALPGDHARRRHRRALVWAAAVICVALICVLICAFNCGQLYRPFPAPITPAPAPLIGRAAGADSDAPPPSAETCFVGHLAPFVTFPDNHSRARLCGLLPSRPCAGAQRLRTCLSAMILPR